MTYRNLSIGYYNPENNLLKIMEQLENLTTLIINHDRLLKELSEKEDKRGSVDGMYTLT